MKLSMVNQKILILLWILYTFKCSESLAARVNECNPESDLVNGGNLNETCSITLTGQQGVYTLILDCPKPCTQKQFEHLRCGYSNNVPIVCCPVGRTDRTISALKCDEYKEYACDNVYALNVIPTDDTTPIPVKMSNCAFTTVALISGGEEAKEREFPHMALVGYNHEDAILWNAGGSLISEQFVLTAAHTFETQIYGPAEYVRLGEHQIEDGAAILPAIDLKIIERIAHPNYNRPIIYDDIGLFKLERKVEFDRAIRPLCLPEQSIKFNFEQEAIATGWGIKENKQKSNVLMKVGLQMFQQAKCVEVYSRRSNYADGIKLTQVCAGSDTRNNNTCSGDSGGPLQVHHETHFCMYTIVGVTSSGFSCDNSDSSAGVYTRVYPYLSWIESIVWPN